MILMQKKYILNLMAPSNNSIMLWPESVDLILKFIFSKVLIFENTLT